MGACCRKLFFTDIYLPFFYTVSAKVGVVWESKVAECSVK